MEAPGKSFQSEETDVALGATADYQGRSVQRKLYKDDNIAGRIEYATACFPESPMRKKFCCLTTQCLRGSVGGGTVRAVNLT